MNEPPQPPSDQDAPLYILHASAKFTRTAKKFLRRHPDLEARFATTLGTLQRDPFAPTLRTHRLGGELDGLWAVSLTYAHRIVLTIRVTQREIALIDIGDHDAVY